MDLENMGNWWFELASEPIDYEQSKKIERLEEDNLHQAMDSKRRFEKLEELVGRQGLLIEVLGRILITKNLVTRQELAVLTQQVDLEDGIEDGRMGADRTAAAPACSNCGRAVNPRRRACVFCRHEIDFNTAVAPRPMVSCGACGKQVEEQLSYLSERGIKCGPCFYR